MRFDIILPCFNEEPYLEKTLDSISSQTHKNWKLWFVDDGSTDKSLSIANSFRIRFPEKVSLFTGSNQGISNVCNFVKNLILQDKSEEKVIALIGANDRWDSNYFSYYKNKFDEFPNVDLIYSDINVEMWTGTPGYSFGIPYHDVFDSKRLFIENPIYTPTVVFRELCLNLAEWDNRLDSIEDWDCNCQLVAAGIKIFHIKEKFTTILVKPPGVGLASKRTLEKNLLFRSKRKLEKFWWNNLDFLTKEDMKKEWVKFMLED